MNRINNLEQQKACDCKRNTTICEQAALIGRFDFSDPAGPVFGWPGSYFRHGSRERA
jgi:hypothetical protein